MNTFLDKLTAKWDQGKFVCVGLDQADFDKNEQVPSFGNKSVIDSTADLVCAYKPNAAFYNDVQLQQTVNYIKTSHPDIPIILDAKRGDIGHTNETYAKAIFDDLGVDALTVHPYLGKESLQPFLDRKDKGIIVLVKTSNPGAGEFQDLMVDGVPLYQEVAEHIVSWNTNGNVAAVVGATYPEDLKIVRRIVGDLPILIPGIGTQGGDLAAIIKNGLNSKKQGLIISASRSIIFAPDPRKATEDLHNQIQDVLKS